MNNTFLDKDVGNQDSGGIDENIVTLHSDVQGGIGQSRNGHVGQVRAVRDNVGNQVVCEHTLERRDGGIGQNVGNSLERSIVGNESRQVGWERSGSNVGSLQSTGCSGEIKRNECGGDILREGQESINDMDNTASEVVILFAN